MIVFYTSGFKKTVVSPDVQPYLLDMRKIMTYSFLNFSYVCPEPVLVNISYECINKWHLKIK